MSSPERKNEISVKVKDQNGSVVVFKMKSNLKFRKLINSYCENKKIPKNSVNFSFQQETIREENTPDDFGMADGSVIEAHVQQKGG